MTDTGHLTSPEIPFAIAAPLRLCRSETDGPNQLSRLYDVSELALRWSSLCLAAEKSHNGGTAETSIWWDGRPLSFGSMLGWFRGILDSSGEPDSLGAALGQACLKGRNNALNAWGALVEARNRTRGHGVTLSNRRARELFNELEPQLIKILDALKPTWRFRPIIVKGINDFDGTWHEHQVLVATGDNPFFSVETLRIDRPLAFRTVHLQEKGGRLLPLDPFVVWRM